MAVTVNSAQRSEDLLGALINWLRDVPDDPFETELVIVPNVGVREWLRSELASHLGSTRSGGDGIVANVDFVFTDWLNGEAIGPDGGLDPRWGLDRLPWSVLSVLHRTPHLLPGSVRPDQLLTRARHVADLFDRYMAHRPEMMRAWLATDGSGDHDGTEETCALSDEHRWQATLFRAVRAEINSPSRAELLVDLPDRMADRAEDGTLPERVALFGLGTITPTQADVIAALGRHRDVLVLTQIPSRSSTTRHPLSRAWGGSAKPTVELLASLGEVERLDRAPETSPSLLSRIQSAVELDLERPSGPMPDTSIGDGSLQVHACHGATRQVEALRDALLHLIAADPTLTARDVLVVCPDLVRFAPMIRPVLAEVLDRAGVPAALADRSLARLSPVAAAIDALFRFSAGRSNVDDLLALLGEPAIASASGLEGHLDVLDRWFDQLNVRWGLDDLHRTRWGYPAGLDQGTWSASVDRLLAGILVPAPDPLQMVGGLVPHDDVADIEAAGLLARFVDRLRWFTATCAVPRTLTDWCDVVSELADGLIAVEETDEWHLRDLRRLLDDLRQDGPIVGGVQIGARDMGGLLTSRLGTLASTTRLRTGSVTVASPPPLRGVPARVVAIVGFDDQAVRAPVDDGDDILALRPRPGERDRLLDHRRGLLDLVLAARDHLIITCDDREVTTGQKVPLTGHLLRLVDAARGEAEATGSGDRPLVVHHSRHLADEVNLRPDAPEAARLVDGRPWTHDPNAARTLVAMQGGDETPTSSASWSMPAQVGDHVDLSDLTDGLSDPGRSLLRDRLGVSLPHGAEESTNEVDLWPDGLALWRLGDDLLLRRLRGRSTGAWRDHQRLLGELPPGALGEAVLDEVEVEVDLIVDRAGLVLPVPTESRTIEAVVGGTVVRTEVPDGSDQLPYLRFVRWHPSLQLAPWLHLATATLAEPDVDWTAVVASRGPGKGKGKGKGKDPMVTHLRLISDGGDRRTAATLILENALDLDRRARSDAIPFFRRYSWSLLSGQATTVKADLARDVSDRWTNWIHGDLTVTDLESDADPDHPTDDGLPPGAFRAERYARLLHDTWTATVEEVTPTTGHDPEAADR
jgi:exodeoxyribonuclease V gamma subunit